jgi:hypothetical protein
VPHLSDLYDDDSNHIGIVLVCYHEILENTKQSINISYDSKEETSIKMCSNN